MLDRHTRRAHSRRRLQRSAQAPAACKPQNPSESSSASRACTAASRIGGTSRCSASTRRGGSEESVSLCLPKMFWFHVCPSSARSRAFWGVPCARSELRQKFVYPTYPTRRPFLFIHSCCPSSFRDDELTCDLFPSCSHSSRPFVLRGFALRGGSLFPTSSRSFYA